MLSTVIKKTAAALGIAAMAVMAAPAKAAVFTYNFGDLLTGPNYLPSSASFATLVVDDHDKANTWDFTLTIANTLFSYFGDDAFIGSMSFDVTPELSSWKAAKSTFIDSNVGGVTSVYSTGGTGLSGLADIDFGTQFGKGSGNRLSQNDYVHWQVTGLVGRSLTDNMYVHVQGLEDGQSAKYTPLSPPPVPEPETYAMLLVGLGLLSFTARRRKLNA